MNEPTGAEQGHTVDIIIQELEPTQQQVTHTLELVSSSVSVKTHSGQCMFY